MLPNVMKKEFKKENEKKNPDKKGILIAFGFQPLSYHWNQRPLSSI